MSGSVPESVVEEIKARTDLADLISSYGVRVVSAGSSKKACCPFHQEKTPSFNINENRGFYHCFGCGESGDAISFVRKMEGISFIDAVKKLAERCGVKIEERENPAAARRARLLALLAEIAQFYHRCLLKAGEGAAAREYLVRRGLDGAPCEEYLLGYAPSGAGNILKWAAKYGYTAAELDEAGIVKSPDRPGDRGYHRFGGRLMFPIKDRRGRVVGFSGRQLAASKNSGKYVNSPETPVFKKSSVLYGFDRAAGAVTKDPRREVIVCEGQIDCIRLQTSGFPNSVAGQGTAFTEEHVRMLGKVADQVALVYDDDAAGHKATIKSARLCLAAGLPVRVVSLPGGDDPDSFLRTHPAEDFRRMLDGAESIMAFQIRAERAAERSPDSVDAVNRTARAVLTTVARCSNAVVAAGMIGEAAKALGLPPAALNAELEKIVADGAASAPAPETRTGPGDETDASDAAAGAAAEPGEDAGETCPPPETEMALCEFLMANEYDRTLDGMIGEFMPRRVFSHDFTVRFVEAWRAGVVGGGDALADLPDGLSPREKEWFGRIVIDSRLSQASGESAPRNLQRFIRSVWTAHLKRLRGELPAAGGAAADEARIRITCQIAVLRDNKWSDVKELIRDAIRHGEKSGRDG
ncbi:MAG: DNA primase [Kiritimatiellae bacterium]|nr:DNA primase [Kiritimatiellia bacterium]